MNAVKSSSIRSIGYDSRTSELYVQFLTESVYVYADVNEDVFVEFITSQSKGIFFNRKIKDQYEYRPWPD